MNIQHRMMAILAGWLIIFVGYVGRQEWSIASGTKVRLQTRPVDPNDFFRGDYVTLSYDIGDVCAHGGYEDDGLSMRERISNGRTVYIPLVSSGDIVLGTSCETQKPHKGIYIKGKNSYRNTQFGIEKYFVQQGSGKPLEEARGIMKMQVSISNNGTARIIGYSLD